MTQLGRPPFFPAHDDAGGTPEFASGRWHPSRVVRRPLPACGARTKRTSGLQIDSEWCNGAPLNYPERSVFKIGGVECVFTPFLKSLSMWEISSSTTQNWFYFKKNFISLPAVVFGDILWSESPARKASSLCFCPKKKVFVFLPWKGGCSRVQDFESVCWNFPPPPRFCVCVCVCAPCLSAI